MDANICLQNSYDRPVLTRFLSITSYLQAYYSYRKEAEQTFSYEIWANELNFKSRSSLRMITFGKRNISDTLIETFATQENLSDSEKQYLVLLSNLQESKNIQLKKIFLDKSKFAQLKESTISCVTPRFHYT